MANNLTAKQEIERLEVLSNLSKELSSYKQISEKSGISYGSINSLLKRFPEEKAKIDKNLENNRKKKAKKATSKRKSLEEKIKMIFDASEKVGTYREITQLTGFGYSTIKNVVKSDEFKDLKDKFEENLSKNSSKNKKSGESDPAVPKKKTETCSADVYMIHDSISRVKHIEVTLAKLSQSARFAVTDITLDELKAAKDSDDETVSITAKIIYRILERNLDKFDYYRLKEKRSNFLTDNELIIDLCKERSIKLITASVDMFIRGRLSGVQVLFLSNHPRRYEKYDFAEILRKLKENQEEARKQEKQQIQDEQRTQDKCKEDKELTDSVEESSQEFAGNPAKAMEEEHLESTDSREVKIRVKNNVKRKNLIELSELELKDGQMFYIPKTDIFAEVWDSNYTEKTEVHDEPIELKPGMHLYLAEYRRRSGLLILSAYDIQRIDSKLLFRTFRKAIEPFDELFNIYNPKMKKFAEKVRENLN